MSAPPEKCQACGFSSSHTKQKPGEKLEFVACCKRWFCEACREDKGCTGDSDHAVIPQARGGYPNGVPPNDGIYARIPESVYHGDHTSLSSSGARTLLNETPEQFHHNRYEPPNPKPAFDFGHAAHKMVLGEGSELVVVDADSWRGKDAQILRNKAWAEGKAPLLKVDIDKAQRMAGKVHEHPLASRLLARGNAEMSGYWHDDETKARLRFRPDFLPDLGRSRMICVDYKTAASANPTHFQRAVANFGYHQQAAWYLDGLREVEISDDAAFVFVVQQKNPPFSVSVIELDSVAIDLGRRLNRRAIDTYAQCVAENRWPGFGNTVHLVSLPSYAIYQQEEVLA